MFFGWMAGNKPTKPTKPTEAVAEVFRHTKPTHPTGWAADTAYDPATTTVPMHGTATDSGSQRHAGTHARPRRLRLARDYTTLGDTMDDTTDITEMTPREARKHVEALFKKIASLRADGDTDALEK